MDHKLDDGPVFSVIIPVYNVESYLRPCLDSVLAQDARSEYEAILVDDGSTDSSGAICDEYATKHPGIFRAMHIPNGGVSQARNLGMDAAKGAYITFLDADDLLDAQALATLSSLLETRPDMAFFSIRDFNERGRIYCSPLFPQEDETGDAWLWRCADAGGLPLVSACGYAFSVAFLRRCGLRFSDKLTASEDADFVMSCLSQTESVRGTDRVCYYYRYREGSASKTPSFEKTFMVSRTVVKWFRRYPSAPWAEYFTRQALGISKVASPAEAKELISFYRKNRDILDYVERRDMKIARALFRIFGFYSGSVIANIAIDLRNRICGVSSR